MSCKVAIIASLLLVTLVLPCLGSLGPSNVAVVVNQNSSVSIAVGQYYCQKAGIPLSNLLEVGTATDEVISAQDYGLLAAQVRSKLVTQIGVDPDDYANDPIQVLVLCYGIPTMIVGSRTDSVDSYLTLLFNRDPDLGLSV